MSDFISDSADISSLLASLKVKTCTHMLTNDQAQIHTEDDIVGKTLALPLSDSTLIMSVDLY